MSFTPIAPDTCDLCDNPPPDGEGLLRVEAPHLSAYRFWLCLDCARAVRNAIGDD